MGTSFKTYMLIGKREVMLSEKVAVITGATEGIGRAIALRYAEEGASVVIGDIREDPMYSDRTTAKVIERKGGHANFVKCDVTNYNDVDNLVKSAVQDFGSIDIMVNNAGILQESLLHETSEEDWRRLMKINVDGVFYGSKAAITEMLDQPSGGNIVNVSSISGKIGRQNAPAYCASKGAVTMLTRQSAIDYGSKGIRVNAVAPGGTLTNMVSEEMDETRKSYLESQTPMRRLADPEEIADAATYLASDMASYINGHVLIVDGGFSIV